MKRILNTTFRPHGKKDIFFCEDPFVMKGDKVVVELEQGISLTQVTDILQSLPKSIEPSTVPSIIRKATQKDLEQVNKNKELSKNAFAFCKSCIHEHQLPMKLVDVEITLDQSKYIFYFTAPNRIDFRDLVKDLIREYRAKIELRQIGERHETQLTGAIGNCGRVCCCRRFLKDFSPVSIKMAKEQNVFLNPTKISGSCGKLLCCLSYEQENYQIFNKQSPKIGKRYQTDQGSLKVIRTNLFKNTITVLNMSNEEIEYTLEEWDKLHPTHTTPQTIKQNIPHQNKTSHPSSDFLTLLSDHDTHKVDDNSLDTILTES